MDLFYVLPDNTTVIVAGTQSKRHVIDMKDFHYLLDRGLVRAQRPIPLVTGSEDDRQLAILPWSVSGSRLSVAAASVVAPSDDVKHLVPDEWWPGTTMSST